MAIGLKTNDLQAYEAYASVTMWDFMLYVGL